MEHRIVWVHGIGDHSAGYSDEWRINVNRHLHLPANAYIEVLWETVFDAVPGSTRAGERGVTGDGPDLALTPQETLAAEEVHEELVTLLEARKSALDQAQPAATDRTTRADEDAIVEWAASPEEAEPATTRGLLTWLFKPDEYLMDFVKYLVSRSVRTAVRERMKEQLRPLASGDYRIAIASHSWGTVVAYDSLLDLSAEVPDLEVATLFTFGSPLWMVRHLLENRSGRKPPDVTTWLNITARGDLVGSWLRPAFDVDRDLQVPSVGESDPHGSYFVDGNDSVQRDIIARYILER